MKGKLVLTAAVAALVGVALIAGAGPLTIGGATGLGTVPDANTMPSMTATGEYTYIDAAGGIDIYSIGAGWEGFEASYTWWNGGFDDDNYVSAKYQLDLGKYDPEFDLPLKLAVGAGDIFDNSVFGASWYVVGTYCYELGAPVLGDVIPTLEFTLGTGNEMYDDVFYGIKADLGQFAAWYEKLDTGESDRDWNWGVEFNPDSLPELTVAYSDIWEADLYSVAYNLCF